MQERAAVFLLVLAWSVEFLVAWSTGFHLLVAQIGWMRPMHWAAGNGQRQALILKDGYRAYGAFANCVFGRNG